VHALHGASSDGRGGGIAVIYRDTIDLSVVILGQFGEFESLLVRPNSKQLTAGKIDYNLEELIS